MSVLNTARRIVRYILKGIPEKKVFADISLIQYGNMLCGKNIIITGGGHGIGKNIASKFISEGANVLLIGRNEALLSNTCSELGNKSKYILFDLENIGGIRELYKNITSMMGKIDCIVCNAGISLHEGNIEKVSQEQFEKQIKVNLESIYFLIQECIKNRDGGQLDIICISSERGLQRDDLPYGLSKAALNSLVGGITKRYYRSGVRINAIAPGITTSDLTKKKSNEEITLERVNAGRYILGEEIAEVACFLLSNAAKCISGEIIACDAGEYISSYL